MSGPEASTGSASTDTAAIPLAPPTTPGPLSPIVLPQVWHRVIGSLSLAVALMTIIAGAFQVCIYWPIEIEASFSWFNLLLLVEHVIFAVLGLALIVPSVLVLRGKAAARKWIRFWSWGKILMVLGVFALDLAAPAFYPQPSVSSFSHPYTRDAATITILMIAASAAVGLAWPAFLLLWFRRPKIKADIAKWP